MKKIKVFTEIKISRYSRHMEKSKDNEEVLKISTTRKLSNFLIYPRFQLSLALMNIFILLGSLGVVSYQSFKSFSLLEGIAVDLNLGSDSTYFKVIEFQKQLVLESSITIMILGILLIMAFTLIFSHKSAGAVYRLKKYFQDISQNGYERELNFRDGDLHPDLPEVINKGIKRIKEDCAKEDCAKEVTTKKEL